MSAQSMRLLSTTSEQNMSTRNKTYFTYVCLVGNIKPSDNSAADYGPNSSKRAYLMPDDDAEDVDLNDEDSAIAVERSKALHELIEKRCRTEDSDDNNKDSVLLTPSQTDESSDPENNNYNNPNILKLTKMKWLTESHNGSPDTSLTSLSPVESNTSLDSDDINRSNNSDRYLDTILRLDKEHNMFGLSNITIVGAKPSKKIRKEEDKAVFHQTAIVQICCYKQCCRHKSNTDLPSSLKCGGCRLCCFDPVCPTCPPGPPCGSCKAPCPTPDIPFPCPSKCQMSNGFGLQIKVVRKPKYEPTYVEITPRSSCVLQKPVAARSCHHFPRCMPPSSCFPYLMPCFWPARPAAPCSEPAHCFHNPPCPPARKPKTCIHPDEKCPTDRYCEDSSKKTKCTNLSCLGHNNDTLKKEMAARFEVRHVKHVSAPSSASDAKSQGKRKL